MEDTELLELAAKASGVRLSVIMNGDCGELVRRKDYETGGGVWNPLTDDGDALRLAVKLGLQVTNRFGFAEVVVPGSRGDSGYVEADKGDSYAATRRAIVRAAAEVGLLKPPNA